MSTPLELTRSLVQAGAFLVELTSDDRVPSRVRDEARRLLRHFPTVDHVEALAASAVGVVGPLLDTRIEPEWWSGYSKGPHRL
jgi:hypothetical protein